MTCLLGLPYNCLYSLMVIWCLYSTCFLRNARVTTWSQEQQKVLQVFVGSSLNTFVFWFLWSVSTGLYFCLLTSTFPFVDLLHKLSRRLPLVDMPHILPGLKLSVHWGIKGLRPLAKDYRDFHFRGITISHRRRELKTFQWEPYNLVDFFGKVFIILIFI